MRIKTFLSHRHMKRRAFSLIEMLLVIAVIGAAMALVLPLYRQYQIRSDLDLATQQATQGLARARLLSQSGQGAAQWGFHVPSGTLYKGASYVERDTALDELYPMPSTIAVNGLLEVTYSRIAGDPDTTGTIVLRALNNDLRIIQVTIGVDAQNIPTTVGDTFTICHHVSAGASSWQTLLIPDSTWPSHQAHGDTLGSCGGASSSSASSVQSSSSSSSGGGSLCGKFTIDGDQLVTLTQQSSVTFTNMLSQITFGEGGPVVPVHACYSVSGGTNLASLYGGNGNCKGNGNAYGNAVKPNGTDVKTLTLQAGARLAVQIRGRYKQNGWLAFEERYLTNDRTGHILLLKNNDQLASYPGFGSQTSLKNYLVGQGKADASGRITIGQCELLLVTELSTLDTDAADFQDDVMLLGFQ